MKKFLIKAHNKHGNKYDYSLVDYKGSRIKIKIICPEHGIFEMEPANHLRGQCCPICKGVKLKTKDEFIKKSKIVHNNKYDYSLVDYKNNKTKVKIICTEHGIFETRPDNHTNSKSGCPICANNQLYTREKFIEKSTIVHNNKFDYSLVDYFTGHIKVKIICPEHGIFEQKPSSHLLGMGCPRCFGLNKNTKDFIKDCMIIHGNKYNYSLVEYINNYTKVKIICPEHGIFEQSPNSHLRGKGCQKCYNKKMKYNNDDFIKLSILKHGNKYNYSLVDYKHSNNNVEIICPEHGVFEQRSSSHINGSGCPMCNDSKGEKEISLLLDSMNIKYERQKKFDDCIDNKKLPFDFYLPDYNVCIEYDGMQHFKSIIYFGGLKNLEIVKRHDDIKNKFCEKNNIRLIRIKYNQNIEKILYSIDF
ncbi:hypothetical protein M0Q50_03010 [bacterium]|jgi:very-short-patch-repair endonuclease|nr:hypothetical protein [bacterium]